MAKGKSRKGSGKGKAPVKRKAAKARKPVVRKAAKAKKPVVPKPVVRPALRRPVKNRPSVARMPSARPAPHKAALLSPNIYERDLDKTPANYAPLTPLQFLERTASVYPDQHRAGARRAPPELGRDLCALPAARLGAGDEWASASATRWRSWRPTSRRCTRRISACR